MDLLDYRCLMDRWVASVALSLCYPSQGPGSDVRKNEETGLEKCPEERKAGTLCKIDILERIN